MIRLTMPNSFEKRKNLTQPQSYKVIPIYLPITTSLHFIGKTVIIGKGAGEEGIDQNNFSIFHRSKQNKTNLNQSGIIFDQIPSSELLFLTTYLTFHLSFTCLTKK